MSRLKKALAGWRGDTVYDPPRLDVEDVRHRVRKEGARAGAAVARGVELPVAKDELPGRKWVTERFEEHMKLVETHFVRRRRDIAAELEVLGEELRDTGSELERVEALVAELEAVQHENHTRPEQQRDLRVQHRLLQAKAAWARLREQRHGHDLRREEFEERLKQIDEELRVELDHLRESCDSMVQEHDMAFLAAQTAEKRSRLGGLLGR
jgi:hypothetical protein